jgi:c-di-GMP-binding flagellar brake protein YcgR
MEISERRIAKRLKTNLPISFEQGAPLKRFGETTTKDISTTGLRMNMATFFAPNSQCLLRLRFPEINRIIETVARVVWSHRISYSDQYQAGLEFCEMNTIFKKWLEEYILINETLAR